MTETTKITRELFKMVYDWGRWNLVVDHKAPAYRKLVKQLLKANTGELVSKKLLVDPNTPF